MSSSMAIELFCRTDNANFEDLFFYHDQTTLLTTDHTFLETELPKNNRK